MSFRKQGDLRYHVFDSFPTDLTHAIFTRQGGSSPAPWASLNMGSTVGTNETG
jgi:hypothetical protein